MEIVVKNKSGTIVKIASNSIEARKMVYHLSSVFNEKFEIFLIKDYEKEASHE